jgi:hypothetical protein
LDKHTVVTSPPPSLPTSPPPSLPTSLLSLKRLIGWEGKDAARAALLR